MTTETKELTQESGVPETTTKEKKTAVKQKGQKGTRKKRSREEIIEMKQELAKSPRSWVITADNDQLFNILSNLRRITVLFPYFTKKLGGEFDYAKEGVEVSEKLKALTEVTEETVLYLEEKTAFQQTPQKRK